MSYKRLHWKYKRGTSEYEFDDTWESIVECRCPQLIYQVKFIIMKDPFAGKKADFNVGRQD